MTDKKLRRAWGAISIRYPMFQAFRFYKGLLSVLSITFVVLLISAILWAFGIIQKVGNLQQTSGITENLLATVIELSIMLFLGIGLLLWKSMASREHIRINKINSEIPDALILPINPMSGVTLRVDHTKHYSCPPMLESCMRWVELDREELFLVEAGSLDIPKLTLLSINIDTISNKLRLDFGSCSFFDIFYTHYSPDLVLSSQSATEQSRVVSLRTLFEEPISQYYMHQMFDLATKHEIIPTNLLPNPIGVSGIVLLCTSTCTKVLLRRRGPHEIAAKNLIEWSFAGLIEATKWIHMSEIPFLEFALIELQDEVILKAPALQSIKPEIAPIGLVFNPLYLFQPELFLTAKFTQMTDEIIAQVKDELGDAFIMIPADQLSMEFEKHELKNLCAPGLKLLNRAEPQLFKSSNNASSMNEHLKMAATKNLLYKDIR